MKNTKKLLILVLALIALTLAMSISIFAEESTEPTVHEFSDINSFKSAINSAQAGDIIRMTANTTVQQLNDTGAASAGAPTNKAVIIDLNGFTLTTTGSWGGAYIGGGASIINGTIKHTGNTCAIKACNMDRLEDLTIIVESQKTDTGGVSMRNHAASNNYAHINVIKNVKMIGTGNYGIETYGQGEGVDKTKPVIDLIESCEIDSIKYALDLSCSVGTIKDCVLSGSQAGISCKYSNGFVIALNLEGDNDIMGGNCAVYLQTSVTLVADEYTDFINTNGGATFSASETNVNNSTLDIVGFSNVNGALVECAHEIEGGSCTERATCSVCGKVFDYVHTWVEDVSKRVAANCTVQGKAYFNCECGATKEEFIARDPNAHEWVETVVDATHTTVGGKTYNCKYGSCVGEEYTIEIPMIPHEYDDGVVTQPTCTEDGYTTYTCECGHSYTDNVVAALGHNYVAGEEVDGKTVYTCSNCGDSYSCTHNFAIVESADATCTEAGYAKYECSLCGEIKEETTPKEEHTYDWNICGCPKCGTVATPDVEGGNVSTNLGYTVFFAASWQEIANNVSASSTYDVIRLTADSTASSYAQVKNKNILIDLGGHTITTSKGLASIYLYMAKGLVNGTLSHSGGRQGLVCYNVDFIEDVTINITDPNTKDTTGIIINSNAAYGDSYVGSMKNVTVKNAMNHGIEAPNANTVIGLMDSVTVYANGRSDKGQAFSTKATVGSITNCKFYGNNVGLAISNLQGAYNLENCEVYGGVLAIQITAAANNSSFSFDAQTSITSSGAAFYVDDSVKNNTLCDISSIESAVALVNGKLFTDLDLAIEALNTSKEEVTTFTLINDLEIEKAIVINKNVNFSLGGGTFKIPHYGKATYDEVTVLGYTISAPNDVNGDGIFHVVEGGVLTLSGDGTVNSVGNNIYNIAVWADGGEVIINGGTYTNVGEGLTEDHYDLIYVKNGGSVVINGGTFIAQTPKWTLNLNDSTEGSIVVNGGNFYAYNPAASETEPGGACSFMAEGKCLILVEEGDLAGYYVVGEHVWVDATCTEVKTCSVCGTTEGEALGHDYVASEPAENGDITYTCSRCGDSYVVNNVVVNGEYFMGTDAVVFENGVLTFGGE